ncbi:MAG: hypothetical protein IBX64_05760 [Actinobacteria bacterium]|nr:hypothetical protein [Actinomycetota bacterium]
MKAIGSIFEGQTGQLEHVRPSFEFYEAIEKRSLVERAVPLKHLKESPASRITLELL